MRIVVTGGAGFIGSNIVDAYVTAGHQVLVLDDLSTGRRENVNPKAQFCQADIRSEEAATLLTEFRPEVVNHHAAQMDVRKSVSDPKFDAEVNLLGLINILEAASRKYTRRVIFSSSGGAAYGDGAPIPTSETTAVGPASPYGVAKVASELYLDCFRQMYGLNYVALRYANVYGPRQNPKGEAGVVAIFGSRLLKDEGCVIYGDGLQTRDFVFVRDVVRANVLALTTEYVGILNIGTGVETDVNTLYETMREAAQSPIHARHEPGKPGEQRRSAIDAGKAEKVLGWKPTVSLKMGLTETLAWLGGQ